MPDLSPATIKALIRYAFDKGGPAGPHVTRFSMYNALKDVFKEHDGPTTQTLAISDSVRFGKYVLGLRQTVYTEANYPEINILNLPFSEASFDFCISDQVLEHVEGDPFVAVQEVARVLKPGGIMCHTTCFNYHVHGVPKDFWRFTPDALELLATRAGCEVMMVNGWGNRDAWALIEAGFRFDGIPVDQGNPLLEIATRNDPLWPIVVWIVARKPLT